MRAARISSSGAALENVGESLSLIGKSLFVATKGLVEQVIPVVMSLLGACSVL